MSEQLKLDEKWVADFCRKWRIRELSIFGSALREDFSKESDVDILVSFEPDAHLNIEDLLDMKTQLEEHFERPIDLVEKEAIRNPWRKYEILKTRKTVYTA